MRRATTVIAAALAAAVLGACGDDDGGTAAPPAPHAGGGAASLGHIHGLGVGPDDDTLYVATHSGLFEAPEGQQELRRIGEGQQDIMGFSVVEAGRFIGSGHPDPADTSSPPNLGLIESRDRGRTWKNVSLHGEADFHVLQSSGERVYGFDGTQGRLMVSSDGGRQWEQRTPPGAMFDLAIDPRDLDRIVVSTDRGVFSSTNAGRGWRPLRNDIAGLLAWPAADSLYLVDGEGQVQRSADGGRQWQPAGSIGGPPAAFVAHGSELYAGLHDATVRHSADGGATWTLRATP
jgi:hypothetical protein